MIFVSVRLTGVLAKYPGTFLIPFSKSAHNPISVYTIDIYTEEINIDFTLKQAYTYHY